MASDDARSITATILSYLLAELESSNPQRISKKFGHVFPFSIETA
jgi:hypothetical protein